VVPVVSALACPVCSAPIPPTASRCDYCGAWVVIAVDHPAIDPASIDRARIDEHIARFRAALARNPADASAHFGLGIAYFNLGLPHEAAAELTEAARLTPENPAIHVMLGVVQADLADLGVAGATSLAAERARRALVLDPRHAGARLLQARLADRAGDDATFLERLRDARIADPDAIRPVAAGWLVRHQAILATAPQFQRPARGAAPPPSTADAAVARARGRALGLFAASILFCMIGSRLTPAPAEGVEPGTLSTLFGLTVFVMLIAVVVYAIKWLIASRRRGREAAATTSSGIPIPVYLAMQPYLEGTVEEPQQLLDAIAWVIAERDRLRATGVATPGQPAASARW
jgi:hypothetical protein